MSVDVEAVKQRQRMTWAAGDFDRVAELILGVGRDLVDRVGVSEDMEVLDVGAGTGNAAIPAAAAGARVVASDLTPELFEAGRRRAAAAGVELEWVEADAEALPFEDGRFDAVISTFGAIFAPRHDVTASELARVCRPGGRIGMANWTPEGFVGRFFGLVGSYLPPPEGLTPPIVWGDEAHVRELFEPLGVSLDLERRMAVQTADSVESYVSIFENYFGPVVMAKAALEADGRWDEFRREYVQTVSEGNIATDGTFRVEAEYLSVLGHKAG